MRFHYIYSRIRGGLKRRQGVTAVWLTGRAAPYRRPVWVALADFFDLDVVLLESNRRFLRAPGNRGVDWVASSSSKYRTRHLPAFRMTRGELTMYLALGMIFNPFVRPAVILLGGWESPAYWQALAVAKMLGVRTVGFYESTLRSQRHPSGPISSARRFFFRRLDAVVVPGPAARDAALSMRVSADRIHVGFNAVDVRWIHEAVRRERGNSRPHVQQGHRYLFMGQLILRKNILNLLRAFATVRRDGDTLTLAGQGPLLNDVKSLVNELGIDSAVSIVGHIPYSSVPTLLAKNDTLVLPSTEEVWGLVVNEALAGGLHSVVSANSGVAESVKDMNGVFISLDSVESLATSLQISRAHWKGPIESPSILDHTPEEFARVFARAFRP